MKGRALIQVNLAVFLFGTAGLFAKWLDLPAIAITLGRVVFSSLALGVFALVTRQSLRVKGRGFFLLVLGETPSFREIAGAAVIIGVVVLSQLLPGKGKGRAGA